MKYLLFLIHILLILFLPPILHTPNASCSQDSIEMLFQSWVLPTQTNLFILHKTISLHFAHEALSPWIDLLILDFPRFNLWSPPLHCLHSLLWWVIQSHSLKYFFAKDSEIDLPYPVFFSVSQTYVIKLIIPPGSLIDFSNITCPKLYSWSSIQNCSSLSQRVKTPSLQLLTPKTWNSLLHIPLSLANPVQCIRKSFGSTFKL